MRYFQYTYTERILSSINPIFPKNRIATLMDELTLESINVKHRVRKLFFINLHIHFISINPLYTGNPK